MSEKTCAEIIDIQKEGREQNLRDIFVAMRDPDHDIFEEAVDSLDQLVLCIDVHKIIEVHLSTGGPADWLEIYLDGVNQIRNVKYHYADWFDHAAVNVDESSALYEYAESIVENLES